MQQGERPVPKGERQRLIGSFVARSRIGTQLELRDALSKAGCAVTQATISRDIAELGLEKMRDNLGRPRYVAPARARHDPRTALASVLEQFGRRATPAGNLVVLAAELGTAPAIAGALDRVGHPSVVGTLAGDDTVLVVTQSAAEARKLYRELDRLIAS